MTKPIIQQLAERAGIITTGLPGGRLSREDSQASLLLFELCAYLDEQTEPDSTHAWCAICGATEKAPYPRRNWTSDNVFRACCDGCWKALQLSAAPKHLTRAEQKRPPPPDELVGALHDPIHPPSGNLISASPVRVKKGGWFTAFDKAGCIRAGYVQCSECQADMTIKAAAKHECQAETPQPPAAPEVAEPMQCVEDTRGQEERHAEELQAAAVRWNIAQADLSNAGDRIESLEQQLAEAREALARVERDAAQCHARNDELLSERHSLKAELASRCDHHAAIHELNRELVEAREALAHAEECNAANVKHAVAQYNKLQRVRREIRRLNAVMRNNNTDRLSREERTRELGAAHRAELAKVTAERDAIKAHHDEWFDRIVNGQGDPEKEAALATIRTCVEELAAKCDTLTAERDELMAQLAWERAWDLHTKVAMGAVVEAARAVYRRIDAEGKLEYHGHSYRPGDCSSCQELNALRDALTAAAAKPPEP